MSSIYLRDKGLREGRIRVLKNSIRDTTNLSAKINFEMELDKLNHMTEYEEICNSKSIKELRADFRYQVKELGYDETDSYPQYIKDLVASRIEDGGIDEYDIKFKGIDDCNRPVYKVEYLNVYVGDVNKLFNWSATKEEVDTYFKDNIDALVIFGSTFNKHDPLGTNLKDYIKLNII